MSGVIDGRGQQWERCCQCSAWVRFEELRYGPVRKDLVPRWPEHKNLDLCAECAEEEEEST